MKGSLWFRYGAPAAGLAAMALAASCSGGGGGGGGEVTTFRGNLADRTAFLAPRGKVPPSTLRLVLRELSPIGVAYAQVGGVEVCVEGTSFCTTTDEDGSFTLPADVSGVVTLVFTGADFTARITLPDVPAGATITLGDIECSASTGICEADDIDIDEPSDVSGEPSDPSDLEPSDPSEPSPSESGDVSDVSEPSDVSGPSDDDEPSVDEEPSDDEPSDDDEPSIDD